MKSKLYLILLSSIFLFALFIYSDLKLNDGNLHLVFCDVGQGDAIYIRSPGGADILIDGGPDDSVLNCLSSHMPFWDKNLEIAFLTHPDADHMTGFAEVIKRYGIDSFYVSDVESDTLLYKEFKKLIKEKNISIKIIYKGDNLRLSDGLVIATLWPGKKFVKGEKLKSSIPNKNIFSLVQLLKFGSKKVLLTGDIEAEVLDDIVSGLDIDILKLPHHGAKSGADSLTFSKIHPEVAVISVGEKNRYGHPANEVLSLLKQNNIQFKRTDKDGEVEFVVSSEGVVFSAK